MQALGPGHKKTLPPQVHLDQSCGKSAGKAQVQGERGFDFAHVHAGQAADQGLEARFVSHDLIGHDPGSGADDINQCFARIHAFDVRCHRDHYYPRRMKIGGIIARNNGGPGFCCVLRRT